MISFDCVKDSGRRNEFRHQNQFTYCSVTYVCYVCKQINRELNNNNRAEDLRIVCKTYLYVNICECTLKPHEQIRASNSKMHLILYGHMIYNNHMYGEHY